MPETLHNERLKDKRPFHCPNGHGQHFLGQSLEDQLTAARAEARDAREQTERTLAQNARLATDLMDQAKELRTVKRRSRAGMCTLCRRTFKQVRDHMRTQHPAKPAAKKKAETIR